MDPMKDVAEELRWTMQQALDDLQVSLFQPGAPAVGQHLSPAEALLVAATGGAMQVQPSGTPPPPPAEALLAAATGNTVQVPPLGYPPPPPAEAMLAAATSGAVHVPPSDPPPPPPAEALLAAAIGSTVQVPSSDSPPPPPADALLAAATGGAMPVPPSPPPPTEVQFATAPGGVVQVQATADDRRGAKRSREREGTREGESAAEPAAIARRVEDPEQVLLLSATAANSGLLVPAAPGPVTPLLATTAPPGSTMAATTAAMAVPSIAATTPNGCFADMPLATEDPTVIAARQAAAAHAMMMMGQGPAGAAAILPMQPLAAADLALVNGPADPPTHAQKTGKRVDEMLLAMTGLTDLLEVAEAADAAQREREGTHQSQDGHSSGPADAGAVQSSDAPLEDMPLEVQQAALMAQQSLVAQQYQFQEQARLYDEQQKTRRMAIADELQAWPDDGGGVRWRPMHMCKHMFRGECQRGDRCKFAHSFEGLHPFSPEHPNNMTTQLTSFSSASSVLESQPEPEQGEPVTRMQRRQSMCLRFAREGCLLNDRCPYAHTEKDLGTMGLVIISRVKTQICDFWEKSGCVYGKFCMKAHGMEEIGRPKPDYMVKPNKNGRRTLTKE
mmetsp:Transcript_6765/g.16809  ORF Transcript_6765/g.16809 Transcript_6765/m.16809 type:complete len:616 (+) Transcript_6765:133-1980(+)